MIKQIKKAKFNNLEETEVIITFLDDTTTKHTIDDVMREHTSSYLLFLEDGGIVKPFETEDERVARVTMELRTTLMQLCDSKQEAVEKLILDYKATPKQIERYKDKYERAKLGEWDKATNEAIITNYEAMLSAIRAFVDLIEKFRGGVDDMITAGEFEKAQTSIEAGKSFGATTTEADIDAVLGVQDATV